jgi:hypothetical protein
MMKNLLNVFGILIISMCALSCSEDDEVTLLTKEEAVGTWIISVEPAISIAISGQSEFQQEAVVNLKKLFQKDDKYVFNADLSCTVNRGTSVAPYPSTYKIDGESVVFDNYIKFKTSVSGSKLILTAGDAEIQGIVGEQLKAYIGQENGGIKIEESKIPTIIKLVSGKVELVLQKQ